MYKKLNSSQRLSHEVAAHIKMLIRDEKLKPTDKLPNETELGRLFGVSRPTVREAIKSLVSQNIVKIARGKGTFVSHNPGVSDDPLGLEFVFDPNLHHALIEARLIIEPGVARVAAKNASADDINRIESCLEQMQDIVDRHKIGMRKEIEFHLSIAEASKNPVIKRVVPFILESIIKTYANSRPTNIDHREALEEHLKVLTCIRASDPQGAYEAMEAHLENSLQRTIKRAQMQRSRKTPDKRQPV